MGHARADLRRHLGGARPVGGGHQFDERLLAVRCDQPDAAEGAHAAEPNHAGRVHARLRESIQREGRLVVVADAAQDANDASEAREGDGHIAGHAARDALQMFPVDLTVARGQAIDADQDVNIDVADAEEAGIGLIVQA